MGNEKAYGLLFINILIAFSLDRSIPLNAIKYIPALIRLCSVCQCLPDCQKLSSDTFAFGFKQ